jgi:hypothetical protein
MRMSSARQVVSESNWASLVYGTQRTDMMNASWEWDNYIFPFEFAISSSRDSLSTLCLMGIPNRPDFFSGIASMWR